MMNAVKALIRLLCIALGSVLSSFTVVLDPGHGGHDAGCIGQSVCEKDINLAVAQRVACGLKNLGGDYKVVMTRDTDKFVTLQGRCDIANAAKGDIFVSIHTNSVAESNPNRSSIAGASVYTLGLGRADTNLDVAMRENSVMKLEDDYSTTYCGFDPSSAESYIMFEMNQSAHIDSSIRLADRICNRLVSTAGRRNLGVRQEPFWVLVRTAMPAVLIELDFICNPRSEAFLGSEEGRDLLARAIVEGIKNYRANAPAQPSRPTPAHAQQVAQPTPPPQPAQTSQTFFRIQFLTSPRPLAPGDARIAGFPDPVEFYPDGASVKYVTGMFDSSSKANDALAEVRRRYPDAFVIKWRDGSRVR